MKRLLAVWLALLTLFLVTSCSGVEKQPSSQTFFVMDTFLTVTLYEERQDEIEIFRCVNQIAQEIEKKASRTLESSEVSAFNRAEKSYTFSPDMAEMIRMALAMSEATKGAYDITVAPLVDLWNIKEGGPVPEKEALSEALSLVSYQNLTLTDRTLSKSDPRISIDLGSVAKGYAIDQIVSYLKEKGCVAIVNFGGNVALVGTRAESATWGVSIRSPFDAQDLIGKFTVSSGAVAVSGDYERYFEKDGVRYHHILSPFDGYPSRNMRSVAVYAASAAEADMLSTALFVLGKEKAEEFQSQSDYQFAYVMTLSESESYVDDSANDIFTPNGE